MKTRILTVGAVALGVAASATADFAGWSASVVQVGDYYIMNVYAATTGSGDSVLNVFDLQISTNAVGGFHQAGDNPFWAPGLNQAAANSLDSWVTCGTKEDDTAHDGTVADSNTVNFDDANGASDFSTLSYSGSGAGWGVGNPNELVNVAKVLTDGNQGVQTGYGVLVGHFVLSASAVNANTQLYINGAVTMGGFDYGTDGRTFSFFIPGPGALAALAVGGLLRNRRRA